MAATVRDDRALIAVGMVDESGNSVLDMLVQPPDPIVDLRSEITGFELEDFEDVKTTLEQARHMLLARINTAAAQGRAMPVLVGHALHHDLHALKLDYWPVIDTALLYSLKDLKDATPGLAHLTEMVLKQAFRQGAEGHHSHVEDAKAALSLTQHRLENGPSPPIPPPDRKVSSELLRRLLVHRLPLTATQAQVVELFSTGLGNPLASELKTGDSNVEWLSPENRLVAITGDPLVGQASPAKVKTGKRFRTVTVEFADVASASAAFQGLAGVQGVDSIGRPQKDDVPFPAGATGRSRGITVRKFSAHGGQAFGKDTTAQQRRRESRKKDGKAAKRRRTSGRS